MNPENNQTGPVNINEVLLVNPNMGQDRLDEIARQNKLLAEQATRSALEITNVGNEMLDELTAVETNEPSIIQVEATAKNNERIIDRESMIDWPQERIDAAMEAQNQ